MHLVSPVFHCGFLTYIQQILHCICKSCGRILLQAPQVKHFRKLGNKAKRDDDYHLKQYILKSLIEKCKKIKRCLHCNELNGVVKKLPGGHFTHEPYRNATKKDQYLKDSWMDRYEMESKSDKFKKPTISIDKLNANDVLELFEKMNNNDIGLFQMGEKTHPKHLILQNIPVPPNITRPSVESAIRRGTTQVLINFFNFFTTF